MKIDVKNTCIVTQSDGKQTKIEDVESISFEVEFQGLRYTIFKTFGEFVRECWK